jgi:hypothetical protein
MSRKNRRREGFTSTRVAMRADSWGDGALPSVSEAFTALELEFFQKGDEAANAADGSPESAL